MSLHIALIYEDRDAYRAHGSSLNECARFEVGDAADDLETALTSLGHNVTRIPSIYTLLESLVKGESATWDLAFNTTEGLHGSAREGQIPAVLEAYRIPFTFSDAATMALCLDKGKTKMVLDHFGVPTAPFAVVQVDRDEEMTDTCVSDMVRRSCHADALTRFPLFVKPLAEGSSRGIKSCSRVGRREDLGPAVREMLRTSCPSSCGVLVEAFLSGREFTVGIVGTGIDARVLGVSEMVWTGRDGPGSEQENCEETPCVESSCVHVQFTTEVSKATDGWDGIADEVKADMADPEVKLASQSALGAWRALGCRDAGRVDIRLDHSTGEPVAHVLEVNPLAGLRPGWSQLPTIAEHVGVSYRELVGMIVGSAVERCKQRYPNEIILRKGPITPLSPSHSSVGLGQHQKL